MWALTQRLWKEKKWKRVKERVGRGKVKVCMGLRVCICRKLLGPLDKHFLNISRGKFMDEKQCVSGAMGRQQNPSHWSEVFVLITGGANDSSGPLLGAVISSVANSSKCHL